MSIGLAYYGRPGLAKDFIELGFKSLDLEYIQRAVDYLNNHPRAIKGCGITGISTGGAIALASAAMLQEIKYVICLNGTMYCFHTSIKYKDWALKWKIIDPTKLTSGASDTHAFCVLPESPFDDEAKKSLIPFHKKTDVNYFFQHSEDDRNMPSTMYAKHAELLLKHENHQNYKIKIYKKAGHIMEPPHFPLFPCGWQDWANGVLPFGGSPLEHHLAQKEAWEDTITYIKNQHDL